MIAGTHLDYLGTSNSAARRGIIRYKVVGMRQKVVIRALVRRDDGRVLLLRRTGGRPSIDGKYELPGGALHVGEQPLDALKRSLQIHAGIEPETFKLSDVVSFIDPDYRNTQYVFVVYTATLERGVKVSTDDEYDRFCWFEPESIHRDDMTASTNLLLDIAVMSGVSDNEMARGGERSVSGTSSDSMPGDKYAIIHSDGGSRGNPGPSASAYLITDRRGDKVLAQGGKFLGRSDSGMAEYTAVELALQKAIELGITDVDFYSDNMMVVNQINGLFAVHNKEFQPIHARVMKLLFNFRRIHFHHVHREYNTLADDLVNKILDENT